MNFDNFNDIEFGEKALLLRNCKAAERNIMVSPYNALANARAALEILCKGALQERGAYVHENLYCMIRRCINENIFFNEAAATYIRKAGNDTLHANAGAGTLHIVNETNVDKAIKSSQSLYKIMAEVFSKSVIFDVNKIPFGFYEIVRVVPKAKNEVVFGKYNYFVKDPKENYYYFQIFHRNSNDKDNNELGKRGVLAEKEIKKNKKRKRYLLDVHYPSDLLAESDRDYIAYSVYPDSFLLSEMKETNLNEKQIIHIAIDLVNTLIELEKVGNGIHLRNIQPGNVILTPNGEGYMAGIVNMETAKMEGYRTTVSGSLKKLMDDNPYLPTEIRIMKELTSVSWSRVDIYSIAKIMVYCRNPKIVKCEMDADDVHENFSDEMAEVLLHIFESSVNAIMDVQTFGEQLKNVLEECK